MKINIKKTMLTLLLTGSLMLNKSNVYAQNDIDNVSNYFKSTVDNNVVMLDRNYDSKIVGVINIDDVVYRILDCNDNWYLVKYNDLIGYMNSDGLANVDTDTVDEVKHYPLNDIVVTDSKVNFRLEPSLDAKRITSINANTCLSVIAKTDNNWYLVKYNNKFGYVSGKYVYSLLNDINSIYPELKLQNLDVKKLVYVTHSSLNIRNGASLEHEKVGLFTRYECLRVLKEFDGWYFVINNDNVYGYVDKQFTKDLDGKFVVIDISAQKLWLYDENNVLLSTDIVTGKLDTPTNLGIFKVYGKQTCRYLTGEDYSSYVNYWMPFNGGIGMHDATWRKKFGGDIYLDDGSHGCVNMPLDVTDDIYENVSVGTKVLVHK